MLEVHTKRTRSEKGITYGWTNEVFSRRSLNKKDKQKHQQKRTTHCSSDYWLLPFQPCNMNSHFVGYNTMESQRCFSDSPLLIKYHFTAYDNVDFQSLIKLYRLLDNIVYNKHIVLACGWDGTIMFGHAREVHVTLVEPTARALQHRAITQSRNCETSGASMLFVTRVNQAI